MPAQRYTDPVGPDGQTVYSDKPPHDTKNVKKLDFADLPATALPASVLRNARRAPEEHAEAVSGGPHLSAGTVLFTAKWCGYYARAKAYLAEKRIPYQEHDIDTPEGMRAYVAAGGSRGVPVLLYKTEKVRDFSRPAYDTLFADAR